MSKDKTTYQTITEEELRLYLKGELSPRDAHDLERKALHSELEGDALEGWEMNNPAQLVDDLDILRTRLAAKTIHNNHGLWMRIAAIGVLLIVSGYVGWFFVQKTTEQEVISMNKTEPSPAASSNKDPKKTIPESEPIADQLSDQILAENDQMVSQDNSVEITMTIPDIKEEIQQMEEDTKEVAAAEPPKMESIGIDADNALAEITVSDLEIAKPEVTTVLQGRVAGVSVEDRTQTESIAMNRAKTSVARSAATLSATIGQRIIKGVVLDDDKEPLPGVTIMVDGTSKGTISNIDGQFEIEVSPEDEDFVFAFVGFSTAERNISKSDSLIVVLQRDLMALEEVVVVGYGAHERKDLSYSQVTIENDDFSSYQKAQPIDGMDTFKTYIEQNKIYPSSSGEITNISVKKSLGYGCDEEAIRLIEEGPKWIGASSGERKIVSEVSLKIKFP
jgi:hypothetical protein